MYRSLKIAILQSIYSTTVEWNYTSIVEGKLENYTYMEIKVYSETTNGSMKKSQGKLESILRWIKMKIQYMFIWCIKNRIREEIYNCGDLPFGREKISNQQSKYLYLKELEKERQMKLKDIRREGSKD